MVNTWGFAGDVFFKSGIPFVSVGKSTGTDDTTLLQTAIDKSGGRPLWFDDPLYLISAPLTITTSNNAPRFFGTSPGTLNLVSGGDTTIIRAKSAFSGAMLKVKNQANELFGGSIDGIKFDGNNLAQYCLDVGGWNGLEIRNVGLIRATSHGLYGDATVNASGGINMFNVYAGSNGGDGAHLISYFGVFSYQFSSVSNNGSGFWSTGGDQWLFGPNISGNLGVGNLAGVHMPGGNMMQIVGGSINNNAIGHTYKQVQCSGGTDLHITGNCWIFCDTTSASANLPLVYFANWDRGSIQGCRLEWPTNSTNKLGVQVGDGVASSSATRIMLTGNSVLIPNGTGFVFNDNSGGNSLAGCVVGPNTYNVTTPVDATAANAANQPLIIGNAGGTTGVQALLGRGGLAQAATGGFVGIPNISADPTGVPSAATGYSFTAYNPTTKKLWIYDTAWRFVTLT